MFGVGRVIVFVLTCWVGLSYSFAHAYYRDQGTFPSMDWFPRFSKPVSCDTHSCAESNHAPFVLEAIAFVVVS